MHIHICTVTGQPLANLIPLLQEKPDKIILLVTGEMDVKCKAFMTTLKQVGWQLSEIDRIDGFPVAGYETIMERALETFAALQESYADASLTLNVTGGTKLMGMAVFSAFTTVFDDPTRNRVIYTDTQHNQLEIIYPFGGRVEPLQLVLNLVNYLKAEGKSFRSAKSDSLEWRDAVGSRLTATRHLGTHCKQLADLFSLFNRNWSEHNEARNLRSVQAIKLSKPPGNEWRVALEKLSLAGILNWDTESNQLYPGELSALAYLTGGWLEEYVWWLACETGASEVYCNVEFTDDYDRKADLRNEIDIAIVHNNRLLLVECKTGNVTKEGKDTEIVYKLDSLMDNAGGTFGEGLLVSTQPLVHKTSSGRQVNTRARAQSVNIRTLEESQLKDLGKYLKHWVDTGLWKRASP